MLRHSGPGHLGPDAQDHDTRDQDTGNQGRTVQFGQFPNLAQIQLIS